MSPKGKPEEANPQAQLSFLAPQAAPAPRPVIAATQPAPPLPAVAAAASIPPASAVAAEPTAPRIFHVSDLLRAARQTLESRFTDVRVEGEISGFKRSTGGHLYFCLKDQTAQLDCVVYAREAARLKFRVDEGMAVRCRGRLTIYEARGRFQMTVAEIEPVGAGALALAFEQLKQKLAAEGLFEQTRKRALPFLPRRLGVVTSPTGAVIRDIVRVAHRRFPVPILLAPTPVQGDGAAASIAAALRRLEAVADVDVIIVARGGGSLEDLWAFNDEIVARAIFACRVPVISAVGHETDFTIADFVADVRAPTPSAAAERAVPVLADLRGELAVLGRRVGRATLEHLRATRHTLERARNRLGDPRRLLDQRRQTLDEQSERARRALARRLATEHASLRALEKRLLRAHPQRRVQEQRHALTALRHRLETLARGELARRRHVVESTRAKLGALSPLNVLERGFSLAQLADGRLLTQASDAHAGDALRVRLRRGEVHATVVDAPPPPVSAKART